MIMLNEDRESSLYPESQPQFQPGQLVRHRRYHYRGVVVEYDLLCRADDSWYYSNQSQPDKDQPWYHVLVDDTDMTTYAAQENLMPDDLIEPITHPLLQYFFADFQFGRYIRNDTPWPS